MTSPELPMTDHTPALTPHTAEVGGPDVPEGIRRARAAFLSDVAALLADRGTCGRYVCSHRDKRVIVADDYRSVIAEVVKRDIPEDEYLVIRVTPGAGREQQAFADGAELDPA